MGQFRSQPLTQKLSQTSSSPQMQFAVTSMCGWRITMEDSHIARISISEDCSLFAVFDGHGGDQVAKYATQHFVETLVSTQSFKSKKYTKCLIDTFIALDKQMRAAQGQKQLKKIKKQSRSQHGVECQEEQSYAGSAALVCLVTSDYLYVANAGDSRCIVLHNGECHQMSVDNRPQQQIQMTRIKQAGGDVIEGRVNGFINLSRTLGDFQYKSNPDKSWDQQLIICIPYIQQRKLQEIDYIILGSDGVFQKQNANQHILDLIKSQSQEKSLKQIGEAVLNSLVAPSNQSPCGMDNMTLIIVKIKK